MRALFCFVALTASSVSVRAADALLPVETIAAQARPSLVKVLQAGREGLDGLGAGFVVHSDGLIATNLHVIGEARRLEVEMADGQKHEVVEVAATDAHWDLALLRVAQKGLKALPLGDSDTLRQGQPIVAMGNPEGLAFSVVDGVVSAYPDLVNDIPMIRLAVPIEKGNSGGPLLDRQGRVQGILTLKSARTENLGFAMPVNELKRLIAQPNPIPMERWLTIGVLNPRLWQPLMGARWTQRAGIIRASTPGQGFGGRSLCLWKPAQASEQQAMEVAVYVKLEEESGAAGLVFCSDGEDRHYGFYPSAGKLRLTRFEGPDVYSWTILADEPVEAYRAGEWNHLRVRIEPDGLTCWVNGQRVLKHSDTGLRGGRVGLCKFRNTVAEFRGFRIGDNLEEPPLKASVAGRLQQVLETFLSQPGQGREPALQTLADEPGASRQLLAERRRQLEDQAVALRELEKELHCRVVTRELVAELAQPEDKIDLLRATLLLARHDNPELEIEQYLQGFAAMVEELRQDPEIAQGTAPAVRRLIRYLFEEGGFHGSRHDYESRSNSYMNEVLDDREGLPITLSVVFLEMASRLGVRDVHGLPLPGKFMIGYREGPEGEWQLVDAFERGRLLRLEEAALEVSDTGTLDDAVLQPATKRAIILRMLRNLLGSSLETEAAVKESLPYLNLLLALDPEAAMERLTRAQLHQRRGDLQSARQDVHWLIEHFPEDGPAELLQQLERWMHQLAP